MPSGTIETYEGCVDFVTGLLFMGTGGGGSPEDGMAMLSQALVDGLEIGWVDAEEIDDDALTATAYGMGSIAPPDAAADELIRSFGLPDPWPGDAAMLRAVSELSAYLGAEIGCLVAVELGAGNSPTPMVTAARLGIPVVDGDYSGRAVPDEMQGTPFIYGKTSHPFVSVDRWGNIAVVTNTANPFMFERIGKMLSIAGIGGTTLASTPLLGAEMKQILVRGTLTLCLAIGRACREARRSGEDPIAAALEVTGGWRLFDGTVTRTEWEDRDGYMFGTLHIEGSGHWQSHQLLVWFKNENHVTWLDGEPWVCSPDLVALVDPSSGRAFTNTVISEGDAVAVVGMRGLDVFREPEALDHAAGPRYFGFDIEYQAIEELV